MTDAGYVIYEQGAHQVAVVFPSWVAHCFMVPSNARALRAGFVSFRNRKVTCYGRSPSLRLEANQTLDSKIVAVQLNIEGE